MAEQGRFVSTDNVDSNVQHLGQDVRTADSKLSNDSFDLLKQYSSGRIKENYNIERLPDFSQYPDTAYRPPFLSEPVGIGRPELTDEQKKEKQTNTDNQLDSKISSLASDVDRDALKKLDKAIVTGDQQSISDVVKSTDPKKLDAYATELQKNLKDSGSDVQVKVADGKLYIYEPGKGDALEFSKDGTVNVRKLDSDKEGLLAVSPEPVLNRSADTLMKQLSEAVYAPSSDAPSEDAKLVIPSIWPFRHPTVESPNGPITIKPDNIIDHKFPDYIPHQIYD
jgi:hypothetical protein